MPLSPAGRLCHRPSGSHRARHACGVSAAPAQRRGGPDDHPTQAVPTSGFRTTDADHHRRPSVPEWSTEADVGIRHTPAAALPRAGTASRTFAAALIEVMTGRRADRQLPAHCAPAVFGGLRTLTAAMAGEPGTLLSVHVSEPADGVAEVWASLRRHTRVAALAFRL